MIEFKLPILGFAAWSGTGKTTLLCELIPLLAAKGLRLSLIKHAHHDFDIDHPGKDSYELRKAGASEVIVASKKRTAIIREAQEQQPEPVLEDALKNVEVETVDLVLVEGFKQSSIPKIELHRKQLGKPYLYQDDSNIIALAEDEPHAAEHPNINCLDINNPTEIAAYVEQWMSS